MSVVIQAHKLWIKRPQILSNIIDLSRGPKARKYMSFVIQAHKFWIKGPQILSNVITQSQGPKSHKYMSVVTQGFIYSIGSVLNC